MDVFLSARLIELLGIEAQTTIFDPWYNKGIGGEREDYVDYILRILEALKVFSEHLFFWGLPQIVAQDKITHYSNIPLFQYSNCERSELSSYSTTQPFDYV